MSVARNVICWRRLTGGQFPSDSVAVEITHIQTDAALAELLVQAVSRSMKITDCKKATVGSINRLNSVVADAAAGGGRKEFTMSAVTVTGCDVPTPGFCRVAQSTSAP